jgi:hypothetical protein
VSVADGRPSSFPLSDPPVDEFLRLLLVPGLGTSLAARLLGYEALPDDGLLGRDDPLPQSDRITRELTNLASPDGPRDHRQVQAFGEECEEGRERSDLDLGGDVEVARDRFGIEVEVEAQFDEGRLDLAEGF